MASQWNTNYKFIPAQYDDSDLRTISGTIVKN